MDKKLVNISVQICVAFPDRQLLLHLMVPEGSTLIQAIHLSKISDQVPEIALGNCRVGTYGKIKAPDTILKNRDRIEIYRHLVADPKDSRRRRANNKLQAPAIERGKL